VASTRFGASSDFTFVGAWRAEGADEFVWMNGFDDA